jgi:AcrR family transcriptional regulator
LNAEFKLTRPTTVANLLVAPTLEVLLTDSNSRLDSAARLRRLHAAALVECALKGHAGLTIANVARRARVSTASIYASYKDRDGLLVAAMETLFAILASDVIEVPEHDDPMKRVELLLIAHGEVYAQPLWTWVFRLQSVLVGAGYTHLRDLGLQVFQGIDGFWRGFLGQLVAEGHLLDCDLEAVVPQLLGPVERCTIISQLAFGTSEASNAIMADVARHSAETLFRLWGKDTDLNRETPATGSAIEAVQGIADVAFRLDCEIQRERRPRTHQAARTRVLLAAAVTCREAGYHAASMRAVAARASISTATLYKFFNDKADLFTAALEAEFRLHVSFESVRLKEVGPQARLTEALQIIAARACDPHWIWMHQLIMASAISGTPRLVALGQEYRAAVEGFLSRALEAFVPPGTPEMDLAVNNLLGPVERCGVLSLLLFGSEAVPASYLDTVAKVAAANLVYLSTGTGRNPATG